MQKGTRMSSNSMVRRAIKMAWPSVLESFFVSLAGLIDTMMVSSLGPSAVAAVGLTAQPKFIGLAVFISMNVAVSAITARRKGAENQRGANETLVTSLSLAIVFCLITSFLCVLFAAPMMRLSGSNEDTHDAAVQYFTIIMGGLIFSVISMNINAAQRGSGNTRIAMTTNVTSSLVNICFNYLLIGGHFGFPRLGIRGAALATVLGTVVACGMSIQSLFRKKSYVRLRYILKEKLHPTVEAAKAIARIGSSILTENLAMRVGFVATALIAARLGTEAFAVHNVGMNFLGLSFSFGDGMQVAAVALTGQALGAGDKETARKLGRICQRLGLCISFALACLYLFGGRMLYSFYFSDPDILDMGVMISRISTFVVFFQISQIIFGGCLRAGGDVRFTLLASLSSCTVIRTAVTLLTVPVLNMGLLGIWLGVVSDQFSRLIFMSLRFRQGKWLDMRV